VKALRRPRPDLDVGPGERVLAWAALADGGWAAGTRDALYLPGVRLPWEQVQAADWDSEDDRLRVVEVGTWGQPRGRHLVSVSNAAAKDADRLLQLVRERVTASVLLTRHVAVSGRSGVRVVARRAPSGHSEVHWAYEYDEGVDPDDPFVRAAAETALAAAQADVGPL
jgi:hypothetical protein